ncbi:MAG: hypothetical protein AVDCRST_MAG49-115, partial [uncultured Thermomicrobiales bacterium]
GGTSRARHCCSRDHQAESADAAGGHGRVIPRTHRRGTGDCGLPPDVAGPRGTRGIRRTADLGRRADLGGRRVVL